MAQILNFGVLFTFGVAVGLPYALSRWLIGASWLQTSFAFAIWVSLLVLIFCLPGAPQGAGIFAMIFGLMFSWVAVPITALMCRRVNMPDRLINRLEEVARQ